MPALGQQIKGDPGDFEASKSERRCRLENGESDPVRLHDTTDDHVAFEVLLFFHADPVLCAADDSA